MNSSDIESVNLLITTLKKNIKDVAFLFGHETKVCKKWAQELYEAELAKEKLFRDFNK